MRVFFPLIVGNSGNDTWTYLLAEELRKLGCHTSVKPFNHFFQYCPQLLSRRISSLDADIIHANSWNAFAFQGPLPLVTTVNLAMYGGSFQHTKSFPQAVFHRLVHRFEKASVKAADAIVSVSIDVQNQVSEYLGETSHLIRNGIDFPTDEELESYKLLPSPYDENKFNLLFVGSPIRRKGWDLLLGLMECLDESFHLTCCLTRETSRALKGGNKMTVLGRQERAELHSYYVHADAFIFPSRAEGLSLALLEAMAHSLPLITSNISSMPEALDDGKGGVVSHELTPRSIAHDCKALFALGESRLNEMGDYNRAKVKECFSVRKMAMDYLAIYHLVCKK